MKEEINLVADMVSNVEDAMKTANNQQLNIGNEIITGLTNITNAIEEISSNLDPKNDFSYTVGDELHEMNYYLKKIADSLEKIADK